MRPRGSFTVTVDWYDAEDRRHEVECAVSFGSPGCRMTRNGDGWPPDPDVVEIQNVKRVEPDGTRVEVDAAIVPEDSVYDAAVERARDEFEAHQEED